MSRVRGFFIVRESVGAWVVIEPALKHQHTPERAVPVASASKMLAPARADRGWIKDALGAQPFFIQKLLRPRTQRAAQPRCQWRREAPLWSLDQSPRHVFEQHFAQQLLALP